jgi:hypothetical protein
LPFSISRGGRLEFLETGPGLQLQVFGTVFNISFGGQGANKNINNNRLECDTHKHKTDELEGGIEKA